MADTYRLEGNKVMWNGLHAGDFIRDERAVWFSPNRNLPYADRISIWQLGELKRLLALYELVE